MFWKWCKMIGLGLLGLVTLVCAAGAIYQWISTKLDAKRYPPPEQLVDMGGYKLHIHCMGDGTPTVVLDAGLGCDSLEWALVQPEIAKFAKVCSYDRAGYGWSEESPYPRTSEQIVEELHALLSRSNIRPPFIFVGHSFGGLNVQLYAKRYPNEIFGLVLVDSAHEKNIEGLPPEPEQSWLEKMLRSPRIGIFASQLGVHRLLVHSSGSEQALNIPETTRNAILAHQSTTKQVRASFQEYFNFPDNLQQLKKAQLSFGSLPLTVIAAGQAPNTDGMPKAWVQYFQKFLPAWRLLQQDLATRSSNGDLVIAENSDHMIPLHQPEIIVEAVKRMIENNKTADSNPNSFSDSVKNERPDMSKSPLSDDRSKLENFDELFVGDPEQIEKNLKELLPQAFALENRSTYIQIMSQIALAQAMQKNFDVAHETLNTAEKLLTSQDHLARVRILLERGRVWMQAGNNEAALPLFKQSFDLSAAHHFDYHTCNAAHMIAIVAATPEEKIAWNLRAIELAEKSKIERAQAWLGSLYNNLGQAYIEDRKYEKALIALQQAQKFREKEGYLPNVRIAKWAIARALRLLNRTNEALDILLALDNEYDSMMKRNELDMPKGMLDTARGLVCEELAEIYSAKAQFFAETAYKNLSKDEWFKKLEISRLERLNQLRLHEN